MTRASDTGNIALTKPLTIDELRVAQHVIKKVTIQVALNETDVGAGFIPARFMGTGGRK